MRSGQGRQTCCRVCGSSQLSAEYRSDDVIYLSCRHCMSMWPIETDASRKPSPAYTACLISEALAASAATTPRRETRRKRTATNWLATAASRRQRRPEARVRGHTVLHKHLVGNVVRAFAPSHRCQLHPSVRRAGGEGAAED